MVELEQMGALQDFVNYVDAHIPEGGYRQIIPVSEEPWDSLEFSKLRALDKDPGSLYYYATLRAEVAGNIVEFLGVSADPDGGFEVNGMGSSVEFTDDVGAEELPKFLSFFDRLLGEE